MKLLFHSGIFQVSDQTNIYFRRLALLYWIFYTFRLLSIQPIVQALARRLLQIGNAILTLVESKKFLDNLALIPIEKILVESDAPFSKGNIYESPLTYCKLAKVFNVPEQIMSMQIFENFKNILIKSDKQYTFVRLIQCFAKLH